MENGELNQHLVDVYKVAKYYERPDEIVSVVAVVRDDVVILARGWFRHLIILAIRKPHKRGSYKLSETLSSNYLKLSVLKNAFPKCATKIVWYHRWFKIALVRKLLMPIVHTIEFTHKRQSTHHIDKTTAVVDDEVPIINPSIDVYKVRIPSRKRRSVTDRVVNILHV